VAIRTVRLDDEAEETLREVRDATGLPISEALKRGLDALREQVRHAADRRPFEVYEGLDLGPGGSAIAPSTATKRGVMQALKKKLRR